MASKSKRRRRVFRASCILAALIIAGSSFAWFTSTDEVTNRLSASADYGAKIVESFAPPKNWIPGQKVDKDVYTTNTGNVGAYVGMDISGALSVVKEVTVDPSTITTDEVSTTTHTIVYDLAGTPTPLELSDADYNTKVKGGQYCDGGFNGSGTPNGTAYTITSDVSQTTTTTTDSGIFDCVELTKDERYAVEAGAYLAYKPATDGINKVGDLVVAYKDDDITTTVTTYTYKAYKDGTDEQDVVFDSEQTLGDTTQTTGDPEFDAGYTKTVTKGGTTYYVKNVAPTTGTDTVKVDDFVPRAEGLYVFRRSIDVDAAVFPGDTTGASKGAESFTYDAYYYFGGRYYKVVDLAVTPDNVADIAGDGVQTDGNLTGATFNFVKEVTDYVDPVTLEYDNANHRLIATYNAAKAGLDTALTTASQNLDAAEHDYAKAELALRKAIDDAASEDAQVRDLTTARDAAKAARDAAKADYDAKKAAFEALKQRYTEAATEFTNAQSAVVSDINDLVGDGGTIAIAGPVGNQTLVERATAGGIPDDHSKADDYKDAKDAYDDFVADHTINSTANPTDSIEHIYYTYLQELDAEYTEYTMTAGLVPSGTQLSTNALEAEIKKAVAALGYDKLSTFAPTGNDEIHDFHALLTEYKLKTDNYEKALQKYVDDLAKLNNVIDTLNDATTTAATTLAKVDITTAQSKTTVGSDTIKPNTGKLYAALKKAREDFDGYNSTDPVDAAYGETGGAAKTLKEAETALSQAETALQNGTNKVAGNENVKANLKTAWENYYKAKNALYAAEKAKEAAQKKYDKNGDLKIYINLANDVLVGGVGGKWQALPTTVTGNVAHFYYTNILKGGETTTKLIDSVELDKDVTQDMYKYFDFDVNVAMKSAQITYAEDNETITAEATPTNVGATATLAQPKNIDTAITWS